MRSHATPGPGSDITSGQEVTSLIEQEDYA